MRTRLITLAALATAAVAAVLAASAAAGAALSPDELLALYQPVTVFDRTEALSPTSVDDFLADADLQRSENGSFVAAEMPPAGLPVHGDGWRLDHRGCSPAAGLAAVACYRAAERAPSTVYGRHDVRGGTIVLQYWYFYNDNFWSLQYPPSDLAWQAHEGDWEVVTVVLDDQQRPLRAAYSQHCTGEQRSWAGVQKQGETHPVVYVATGSHANLFAPSFPPQLHPIDLDCYTQQIRAILQANGITPVDFLIPVQNRVLGPGTTEIERIQDNAPRWLRFPGTWGEAQFIRIPPPAGPGVVQFGASPTGPQHHDVWIDPLGTIAGYPGS
jgi:Necrosis inducing protein (NPP1)